MEQWQCCFSHLFTNQPIDQSLHFMQSYVSTQVYLSGSSQLRSVIYLHYFSLWGKCNPQYIANDKFFVKSKSQHWTVTQSFVSAIFFFPPRILKRASAERGRPSGHVDAGTDPEPRAPWGGPRQGQKLRPFPSCVSMTSSCLGGSLWEPSSGALLGPRGSGSSF